ncbi:elongation factor Ts [Symbiobacterium terraclitae]|uniref:Elongation factor Ts n=1 Tax=Symbiobacterium terraclitae TaxID=557451 RepID=A0ABS4JQ85_9FIRM|nr:translation elongation factor Ts [Symbiobacterium terraclitae]MBP2017696.1 elongation factor Ts [Symbiobacterium terraclitae]
MAEITAKMVADLRARTGAGMMDCKKALIATDGDFDKAIDYLREKGLATAVKKAGRVAADGRVYAIVEEGDRHGVLVEVNCETDFVAKGEQFIDLCNHVAQLVLKTKPANMEALQEALGDTVKEAVARIGENIQVRRFARYEAPEAGRVHAYIHGDGRVGVLIELATASKAVADHPEVKNLCHELALQIASMKARYVAPADVPAAEIEHEKEILKAQAVNEGKKPEIAEKMVAGRIQKYYKEVCLLEQEWVKDSSKTVGALVKEVAATAGGEITVKQFVRYEKGEGIEKKQDDFQDEVMRQAGLK